MNNFQTKAMELRENALACDKQRVEAQHAAGKLTAKERIAYLADEGSFVELFTLLSGDKKAAGVVCGYMTVDARPVYVFAQEYAQQGAAMGRLAADKILKVLDMAVKTGAPVLALMDSAGVRLDEGAQALNAMGDVYKQLARMSGVCPLITVAAGPCIGGAALIAELSDITVAVDKVTSLMVFGPQVMASMSGAPVDAQAFGGAKVAAESGLAALHAQSEAQAYGMVKQLLSILPSSYLEDSEILDCQDMNRLCEGISADDMAGAMDAIADTGSSLELFAAYGTAMKTRLARMGGRSVLLLGAVGKLDAASITKAARMVRFADSFNLPVITLVNTDGVVLSKPFEQAALIKAQGQLLYAYAEATVPKLTVVLGRAIGQPYIAMGTKANADVSYAWPDAVISSLTPEAAVAIMYAAKVKAETPLSPAEARAKFAQEYAEGLGSALRAAKAGLIDDVIVPEETRARLISALEMLASKRDSNLPKKHGNLPL